MRRRASLKAILLAPFAAVGLTLSRPSTALAIPNGTRPTMLSGLSVVALSSTRMRVTGRYTDLRGMNIAGMPVRIYSVSTATFSQWAIVYTRNDGTFLYEGNKVPVGNRIQVDVEGNGAYSRPYPTLNRP